MSDEYFNKIVEDIIAIEGEEYTNRPSDIGGPTKYGVTQAVARDDGYKGDMRLFPRWWAEKIYKQRYITGPWFDRVYVISEKVGMELIDTGVNMGTGVASIFFQRWLNVFNLRGVYYADLIVDGRIGNATLQSFQAYLRKRGAEGERVMLAALNSLQAVRYLEIAGARASQEDNIYGWLRARVVV